jgi:hypothetical protein
MNSMRSAALAALALGLPTEAAYTWKNVQIHGGGYVPGIAFHPVAGGPAYARTDVGGAYRLAANKRDWIPLNDGFASGNDMGSIAIGLDETDTNAVYLTGGLYLSVAWAGGGSFLRSTDRGTTWTKVPLTKATVSGAVGEFTSKDEICLGGNENTRGAGPRIAARGTTIYLGTNQNGLLRSTNRGDTWTTVTALGDTGVAAVVFDKDGKVYAAPYAGGLYSSTDGTSWSQVPGFTGKIMQMSYAKATNTIWITANASNPPYDMSSGGQGSVWTFDATARTFAPVTLPAKGGKDYGYAGVVVNPSHNKHVVVSTLGWWKGSGSPASAPSYVPHEAVFLSRDGGKTWTDLLANGTFDAASAYSSATSNPHWITGLAIDPADSNHVVFGTGYGVWSTFNATAAKPVWTFTNNGLEETVPLGLASTTVGAPLVSVVGDVDGYYHTRLDVPPTTRHKVEAGTNFDLSVAGKAPTKMVRIHKEAKFGLGAMSEDAGKTWTSFKTTPPFVGTSWNPEYTNESNFAAISADGSSIVWNMQTHGVYVSKDKGATWTKSNTAAASLTSSGGGFRVVADRHAAGVFYLYNPQSGVLYRSLDHGMNWTAVQSSLVKGDDWMWGYLRVFASPRAPGELWITQGQQTTGMWVGENIVYRSLDSGKTITKVASLQSATSIGFGKGLTDAVPAIYVQGLDGSGTKGLFRSTDNGSTWTRIDDDTHRFGGIDRLIGDPCVFSRVYFSGGAARGVLYGEEPGSANTSCPDRLDYGNATGIAPTVRTLPGALVRLGTVVHAQSPEALVRLRDVRGQVVRSGTGTVDLAGLPRGLYLATDGNDVLPVAVSR